MTLKYNFKLRYKIFFLALIFLCIILGTFVPSVERLLSDSNIRTIREYQVGDLCDENIISPIDYFVIDQIKTDKLKDEAISSIAPVFDFSYLAETKISSNLATALDNLKIDDFSSIKDYNLTKLLISNIINTLSHKGIVDSAEIDKSAQTIELRTINPDYSFSSQVVKLNDIYQTENINSIVLTLLGDNIDKLENYIIVNVIKQVVAIIEPNINLNKIETAARINEAINSVDEVGYVISKGDIIVRYDDIISQKHLSIIDQINNNNIPFSIQDILSTFILLTSITLLALFLTNSYTKKAYRLVTNYSIVLITLFLSLLTFTALYSLIHLNLDIFVCSPILFGALITYYLTSNKVISYIYTYTFILYIVITFNLSILTLISYVIYAYFTINLTSKYSTRFSIIINYSVICLVASIILFLSYLFLDYSIEFCLVNSVALSINILVSILLINILLPVLEKIFALPTAFKLKELEEEFAPLLQKLSQEAPGTFNHSTQVAAMSYDAAIALNINAELVRASALFHDIGKLDHPEYFIENQAAGAKNVHDDMKASLSVAVIKSHVKLGVEKAKELDFPQEIIDIIYEHHGTTTIVPFYKKALKEAESSKIKTEVNIEDYKYTNDIPSSKESGLLMLADSFEAASRAQQSSSYASYSKLYTSILNSKLLEEQLNDTNLSVSELNIIKQVFIKHVISREHKRITYEDK